jgi:galactokinase
VKAADEFLAAIGRTPTGLWSAPGRVNLMGEHTDYNGGYVLPFAIDKRTQVAAARRSDERVSVRSVQKPGESVEVALADLEPGKHGWADYVLGTVWALRDKGWRIGGLDIVLDGAVPTGSGLSSSAAIECSVGLAALELYDIDIDREDLARVAQYAENAFVGVPCGLLDQMAVSVCRADYALFFDIRDDVREQVPFAPQDHGLAILVINTRAQHAHAGGEYAERRRSCEEAARQLGVPLLRDIPGADLEIALDKLDDDVLRRRARHIITEDDRVLTTVAYLRAGRLAEIGPVFTQSHASLRDDFEVSVIELDVAVDTALEAGALGARMTGGGFGGSAIALIRASDIEAVTSAVEVAFAQRNLTSPQIWAPVASSGVRRES